MMRRSPLVLALALITVGCGSKSPTSPSTTTPPQQTQTPTRIINVTGSMAFGNIQIGQSFTAVLHIGNAGNSPLTVTSITGTNNIASVIQTRGGGGGVVPPGGNMDVDIIFTPRAATTYTGTITVNADQTSGTNTIAFSGTGTTAGLPLFSRSGVGDSVFDLPSYVNRVNVRATYSGSCQNFIVHVSTQITSLINIIIGTCSVADTRSPFTGTYAINNGGTVEITKSTGINWTFTEVR